MRAETEQDVELGRRQRDFVAVAKHSTWGLIYSNRAEHDRRRRGRAFDSSQDDADAGDQLAHAEWFGDVVVGPNGQPDEHVGLVVTRRQHHDGNFGVNPPTDFYAVEARQHNVEHDDAWLQLIDEIERDQPVGGDGDVEPFAAQAISNGAGDSPIILHHQYVNRHASTVKNELSRCPACVVKIPCRDNACRTES